MDNINKVEWMFTFADGGWNTVWAESRDEAIKKANEEFGNYKPIADSFKEVEKNKGLYNNYLSMFY